MPGLICLTTFSLLLFGILASFDGCFLKSIRFRGFREKFSVVQ
jgi:hypothetical protein